MRRTHQTSSPESNADEPGGLHRGGRPTGGPDAAQASERRPGFYLEPPPLRSDPELQAVEDHIQLSDWLYARRHEPQSTRRRAMERVRERHRLARARNGRLDL